MANPSSTATWSTTGTASLAGAGWLVRRRITLTIVLMALAMTLDVLIGAPRDLAREGLPVIVPAAAILLGLLLRTWAAGTIRKWERLATTGPYAYVRHPLYLGSILFTLGFVGLMRLPLLCLLVLLPLAASYWLAIRQEEATLARRYPEWAAYARRVGGFVPRRLLWPQVRDWSVTQWVRNKEYCAWLGAAAVTGLLLSQPWWGW